MAFFLMLEVDSVDAEDIGDTTGVLDPQCGAVKVDEEPLVGVKDEGVRKFDPLKKRSIFWADESSTAVSSVHMQPNLSCVADRSQFVQAVESTRCGGTHGCTYLHNNSTIRTI